MSEIISNNAEPVPPANELLSETGALPVDMEQTTQNTEGELATSEPVIGQGVTSEPVTSEPVTNEQVTSKPATNDVITLTTNKSILTKLAQNLNANLLVTVAAYKAVLSKIKENTSDAEKQKSLEANIKELEIVENSVTNLLTSVQTNLDVESDKVINASSVLEEAGTSDKFTQRLLNTEAIAILAAMLAPIGLGGGSKRKKKTRRKRNKGNKTTKRDTKI